MSKINYEHLNFTTSVLACLLMASFYVISLYLWSKQNRYNRNDPSVIKRRFVSVLITSILSVMLIYLMAQTADKHTTLNSSIYMWIGFRFDLYNLVTSIFVSILLTVILFSGPLVQQLVSNYMFSVHMSVYEYSSSNDSNNNQLNNSTSSFESNNSRIQKVERLNTFKNFMGFAYESFKTSLLGFNKSTIKKSVQDLCFLRNYVISPFTEEFVFRSCMLPLLLPHLSVAKAVLITPLFFGMAHLHHIIEGYKMKDQSLETLVLQHLFQFSYTYVFGVYSSFLFIRTGNFFSSFLSHSFCNLMGFPNFAELINDFEGYTRVLLVGVYVAGFVLFFVFLTPFTTPGLFENYLFDKFY